MLQSRRAVTGEAEGPLAMAETSTGLSSSRSWWIVGLLSVSIAINLVDRQVLSVVAPVLREQLTLSNTQYSYIILAFQVGLLLGQVPAGVFLDIVGARLGLLFIFLVWSAVNALHSLSRGLKSLIGLRFLLGIAECGNYSGGIKVVAEIFDAERRSLAGGFFNGGAQLGAVLAPPVVVFITLRWGWRAAFLIPSALGLLWLLPWFIIAPRDSPDAARAQHAARGRLPEAPGKVTLGRLLRQRQVLGLMLFRAFTGPLTSFFWYWLPEYLRHGRGMSMAAIGMLAWMPFLAGGIGNVAGGFFSDAQIKRGASEDRARKVSFALGAAFSSLTVALPFAPSVALALGIICLVVFGNQWMVSTYIGAVGDIFPSSVVGRVNGIGGVADSGMGMVTMLLTGVVVDHYSYFPVFIAAAVMPTLALLSILVVVGRIARIAADTSSARVN